MDWSWRGRLAYPHALEQQLAQQAAVRDGTAPESIWLLEHDPVVTTGRRAVDLDELPPQIPVVRTGRGGLATAHMPGQLMGYIFVRLHDRPWGVRVLVDRLQEALVAWCLEQGVDAQTDANAPGVWVGSAKVASIGLAINGGVTMHGFALNLTNDLGLFDHFVPCGLPDRSVTSMAALQGSALTPQQAAPAVADVVLRAVGPV